MARQPSSLDEAVRATQQQISEKQKASSRAVGVSAGLPKGLVLVGVLWLSAIGVLGFQFDKIRTWLFVPSEDAVESDLVRVLEKTALGIEQRRDDAGRLPLRLPNPALQGLVRYDRVNDVSFELEATVSGVTVIYSSATGRAVREE